MKKHAKGRKDAQCVPIKSLASESEVPPGWAFNIIEGRFMEEIQKRKGASWVKQGSIVLIPAGFGMEPTDLETLLNSELARKVGDLQDQLAEYTCPICGEGLSSAGPIQLSEDSDGYYQSFGCGYAAIDGHPESLCPSDPLFPKIRDFDLQVSKIDPQRQVYRAGAEWVCTPIPRTSYARKAHLHSEIGASPEEAKQRVIDGLQRMVGTRAK